MSSTDRIRHVAIRMYYALCITAVIEYCVQIDLLFETA
eukprot:SAG31_NODE_33568_length_342_cov_0.930041_1_plen_37_part_01